MYDKRTALLLTSCIDPQGMKFTQLQDKFVRRSHYVKALNYYIENTSCRIVFCDNSGEELGGLIENNKKEDRVELLSFYGNAYDVDLGKGYGEFEIIQYAFSHSNYLREAQSVIKITGRLIVENLVEVKRIMDTLFRRPNSFVFASMDWGLNYCDSRCFYASADFFVSFFINQPNMINDSKGYYFEHFLCDKIKKCPLCYVISDFAIPLVYRGISGTSGSMYDDKQLNRLDKLKRIRDFCQYEKRRYKNANRKVFWRLCCVSSLVRVLKSIVGRLF